VKKFRKEVLDDFRSPSKDCVTGADFLLEELDNEDPDLNERCGLLADRHEVYAVRVPRCPHLVLAVSLDLGERRPWPCTVHGLLPSQNACEAARQRAARHFDLIDPGWEPAK